MTLNSRRLRHALCALLFAAAAQAATITWTGTTASWNVGSNWSGGVVPTSTDSVFVNSGTPFQPQITLGGDAQNLTIGAGANVTVTDLNNLAISSTGTSTISNSGQLTLAGSAQASNLLVQGTGAVTLNGTGTLQMSGPLAGIVANNTGMTLNNASTIAGQGQIGQNVAMAFNNSGVVNANANAGTLILAAGGTNAGTLKASGGGTLQISNSIDNTGGSVIADNATVTLVGSPGSGLAGTVAVNGALVVENGSGLSVMSLADGTTLNVNGGSGGSITIQSLNSHSASMSSNGSVSLAGSGTLTLNDSTGQMASMFRRRWPTASPSPARELSPAER